MKIQRYAVTATLLLLASITVCIILSSKLGPIFKANIPFNITISVLVLIGAGLCLKNLYQLLRESQWFEAFRANKLKDVNVEPVILRPLKSTFIDNDLHLTPSTLKTCLESVSNRLQSTRIYSRYLISLPIIVGLLGTFWGLSLTITSISQMIGSMPQEMNVEFFSLFKQGLEGPIQGMGIAFSSSLFGLAGSLLLGGLELQVGSAYAHAYDELEGWLTEHMESDMELAASGDVSETFLKSLVKKTVDSVNKLSKTTATATKSQEDTSKLLTTLSAQLKTLTDQSLVEQQLLMKLAEGQLEMQAVFKNLTQTLQIDATTAKYISNLDTQLHGLREDLSKGRERAVLDICDELRVMSEMLAIMNDGKPARKAVKRG